MALKKRCTHITDDNMAIILENHIYYGNGFTPNRNEASENTQNGKLFSDIIDMNLKKMEW